MALCLATCGGTTRGDLTIGKHRAAHGYANGEIPGEYRGQVPALSDAPILGFLPDSTMGALFVRNPKEFEASVEFTTIISEYKEFYSEIRPHVTGPGGINLLQPSTWPIFGVDPNRPAGVALLVGDSSVGVFFVSLTDKELFKKSLDLLGSYSKIGPVIAASAGESTIYVFQGADEVAVVVRGDVAMLVIPDRERDLEAQVLAIAGTGSKPSLASSGRIAKAFAGFDYGKDMAGFLSFDSIAAKLIAESNERSDRLDFEATAEQTRTLIAEAKAANQSKEAIAQLESQLMNSMQSAREFRRRREAQLRLFNEVLGAVGTVAVGVALDGKATRLRAQFSPTPNTLISQIIQETSRPFALPGQLQERPLFLLGAHINIDVASKIFDLILQADGETRKSVSDELKSVLGVTPDELISSFDGELSGALTLNTASNPVAAPQYSAREEAMGLHLMGHLRDPDSAKALFDKMCSQRALAGFVVKHDGRAALEFPSFNSRKIRLQISGDYLEAISVASGESSPNWSKSEQDLLGVPTSRGVMVLDPAMLIRTLSNSDRRDWRYEPDPGESKAEADRARPIRKQLGELYRKRSRLQDEAYGSDSMNARLVVAGHSYAGGYAAIARFEGASKNLGRSLQAMVEAASQKIRFARGGDASELDAIEAQIEQLEDSLWRALEGR